MEDHHVDRPGVEAQQCVELTGTNSSIGLIALIKQCPLEAALSSQVTRQQDQNSEVIAGKPCAIAEGDRKQGGPVKKHVSADLVAMAGCLHPIPFRTRP